MDPVAMVSGAVVASVFYVFAYRRKGRVGTVHVGRRVAELHSDATPDEVFAAIAAIGPPYTLDDKDPATHRLVLSSRPSLWSYGFLYPIELRERATGGTLILVGITSRLFHIGPGVGIAHERCVAAIRELMTVPPARLL